MMKCEGGHHRVHAAIVKPAKVGNIVLPQLDVTNAFGSEVSSPCLEHGFGCIHAHEADVWIQPRHDPELGRRAAPQIEYKISGADNIADLRRTVKINRRQHSLMVPARKYASTFSGSSMMANG